MMHTKLALFSFSFVGSGGLMFLHIALEMNGIDRSFMQQNESNKLGIQHNQNLTFLEKFTFSTWPHTFISFDPIHQDRDQ